MEQFSAAIAFAQSHEIPWPRDPAADPAHWGVHHDDPPPFNGLRVREQVHRLPLVVTGNQFFLAAIKANTTSNESLLSIELVGCDCSCSFPILFKANVFGKRERGLTVS